MQDDIAFGALLVAKSLTMSAWHDLDSVGRRVLRAALQQVLNEMDYEQWQGHAPHPIH